MIRLDVYGKPMLAERTTAGWQLYEPGADGKRRALNVVVPDFVTDDELVQYLDDLFHEAATPRHPSVRRIPD